MSITAVTLTCPHCAARYRVRIDLDKLRKVRSQAQCSHCGNTFDMSTGLLPMGGMGHPTPAQGIVAPEIGTTTPPMGIRSPISGAPTPAQGIRRPPTARTRRPTPVRSRTPAKPLTKPAAARPAPAQPIEPVPVVSVLPNAESLGQEGSPQPLVLSDIPAATSDAVLDTLPSGDWLGRALLPIERLQREPSTGEVALERLLDD